MTTYILSATRSYISSYLGLSSACWQGIILSFAEAMFAGVCYFFSIYFVNELKINMVDAGLIMSCFGLGTIIGGLTGGKLSDKIDPALVSIGSLVIQACGYFALIKLTSVNWLMLDLLIIGIAAYSFITSNHVWVIGQCNNNEAERLKAINLLGVTSNLGLGVSAIIIGSLSTYGFQNIILFSSAFFLIAAVYLFFYLDKTNPDRIVENNTTDSKSETQTINENRKVIWLALSCLFLVGIVVAQLSTTYTVHIQQSFPDRGLSGVSILFAINCFMVVLFQNPIVNYFSSYNKTLMVGAGAMIIGAGMSMLSWPVSFAFVVLSCVVYTVGEMLFFSMVQLVCYQSGRRDKKGQSLGLYRMTYAASRVTGPYVGSYLYLNMGGGILWGLCGLIGAFCDGCGIFMVINKPKKWG